MLVWRRALPLCVLFLCAADEAPRGLCEDKLCIALFLRAVDFTEARGWCRDRGGELLQFRSAPLWPPNGHYWLTDPRVQRDERCWSLDVGPVSRDLKNRTCTDRLDGVLCQYSYTSTCRALQPSGGAHVNYTVMGLEVKTVIPAGTVAVLGTPGGAPDSKHVCAGTEWMQAPWSCEVMSGGCEHACNKTTGACSCPAGQILHHNNFMCTEEPCAKCAPDCVEERGECRCRAGFRLGAGGRCVDINECSEDRTLCSGPGQSCENLEGSHQCVCQDDYELEDGDCVDTSICFDCEQSCNKVQGVMTCVCGQGFRVHPEAPTKCEDYCGQRDCPARCPSKDQCYCPRGYIQDQREEGTFCTDIDECEEETQCEHQCVNTNGSFVCECDEGYLLLEEHLCEPQEPPVPQRVHPTAALAHPTAVPTYVKTGSILGITVFALLCAALVYFMFNTVVRYCTKVQFYSLKHDMDIFTLQQVTTETYKRLSYDWQDTGHRL